MIQLVSSFVCSKDSPFTYTAYEEDIALKGYYTHDLIHILSMRHYAYADSVSDYLLILKTRRVVFLRSAYSA